MTTISPHTTRSNGTILTAAIYNADHNNHITNALNLNAEKIEIVGTPVVDGDGIAWSGTSGRFVRTTGQPSVGGASGNGVLDFGAFPGAPDAQLVITGQAAIVAGSVISANLRGVATADHSIDEHMIETISVRAGSIVPGVGFTVYGVFIPNIDEPEIPLPIGPAEGSDYRRTNARGPLIYGLWNVSWKWS